MTKLVFGCGYLGLRVARLWHEDGEHVIAVTRSEDRSSELADAGLFPIAADVTQQQSLSCIRDGPTLGGRKVDCVLFAVGYDRMSGQSIHQVYAGGVQNVLEALPASVERFIYISTTGVYGLGNGEWVDEITPPNPSRDGGKASLAAEQVLAAHPLGKNSVVLRLAGIYGPRRVPFIDKLRAGEPIPAPTTGHLNLIHVDDAATAVVAAGRMPAFDNGPRVYCVSDGHPFERGDFYREVARGIGAPSPTFVPPEPGSTRAIRAESDRRVRNTRMLNELGVKLKYDNYRAGLTAILETQNQ
jgi:nucleoside-diphosphate-sugar epimerase